MPVRLWSVAALASLILSTATSAIAQDPQTASSLTYDRDAHPILRKRCGNCHNAERPRGELDLLTFAGLMAGGATGKVAVPGRPEESPVYTLPAHLEEPKMPPNSPKIPQREIDILRRWIEGGMLEKPGDSPVVASGPSTPAPARMEQTGGLIAAEAPPVRTAITARAVSPAAPVAAASGHRQVLMFDLAGRKLMGAVAFPEGDVLVLRFSADGQRLLCAGGVGAESGKAVVFETKTWTRVASVGDELDAILAAELSPDGSRIVVGGPGRLVKVIANPDGKVLQTLRKSTDWVTAASFSPDGLLVAAGDRFGGLFVGGQCLQEFLALRGHQKGNQRDRLDRPVRRPRHGWRRRRDSGLEPTHGQGDRPLGCARVGCSLDRCPPFRTNCLHGPRRPREGVAARWQARRGPRPDLRPGDARRIHA